MDKKNDLQDFLRIMILVFDTAPAVLAAFIDSRVFEKHKSFKSFLETLKHSLYHKCKSTVCCCKCPGENYNFCFKKKDRQNALHVFHQLFQTEKVLVNKSHEIKTGTFKKVCICQFTPNDKSTSDFDIETLGLLLFESGLLEEYHKNWFRKMKHRRNELCHLPGTKVLTSKQYEDIWMDLETVITDFAREVGPGIHFLRFVKREIDNLKKSNFTEEQKSSSVKNLIDTMERTNHKEEENGFKKMQELLCSISLQEIKLEEQGKIIKQLQAGLNVLLLERHKNVVATTAVKSMDTESEIVDMNCKVDIPKEWNGQAIVENIGSTSKDKMTENDKFCITASEIGCILLRIAVKKKVFENAETLHFVIQSLLQKIINAGNIDANVPALVSIKLELYTEEHKETSHITTDKYENRLTQTENADIKKEISIETRNIDLSRSLPPPKQLVDYQDVPLEKSTIGILTQMVLDVFPDIIREWIHSHKTIENVSESMTGYFFFGKVNTSLEDCNFPILLEVAKQCKVKNIPILNNDKKSLADSDKNPTDDILRMERIYDRIIGTGSSVINEEEKDKILHEIKEILIRFDELLEKKHFETYEGRFEYLCKYWGFAHDMYSVLDKFGLSFLYPQAEAIAITRKSYRGLFDTSTVKSTDSGHFSDGSGKKKPYEEDDNRTLKRQTRRPTILGTFVETGSSET